MTKPIKTTKCNQCGRDYIKRRPLQSVCSIDCAIWQSHEKQREKVKARVEATAKKRHKARKEALKTKTEWANEAQAAFNLFIRMRDHDKPCISCGRHHQGQYHAGHYRTTKAAKQLRYHADNCHKQCQPCNTHHSGNILEYRINLINRIGRDRVEALESNNEICTHDIEYYKRIKRIFSKRARIYKRLRGIT